jgi:hypothetical protein
MKIKIDRRTLNVVRSLRPHDILEFCLIIHDHIAVQLFVNIVN